MLLDSPFFLYSARNFLTLCLAMLPPVNMATDIYCAIRYFSICVPLRSENFFKSLALRSGCVHTYLNNNPCFTDNIFQQIHTYLKLTERKVSMQYVF